MEFFFIGFSDDGKLKGLNFLFDLHQPGEVVRKRTALTLDVVDYGRFPVPYMEIVHDRANIEVMRGCAQGCRFCQAGYVYRPIREHAADKILAMVDQARRGTGYE